MPGLKYTIKIGSYFRWMCLFVTFVAGVSAHARFEYITQPDGQRVVKTFAKSGEGLAAIIRDLGLKPNWQDQSWIQDIQAANPALVNSSNSFVLEPNTSMIIPVDALKNLEGYTALASQFVVPEEKPLTFVQQAQIPVAPAPPVEPVLIPATQEESAPRPSTDVDLIVGFGFQNLFGEQSSLVDTSLNSQVNAYAGLSLGFYLTENQKLVLSAMPRFVNYYEPPTIDLLQNNEFLFDLGASYGFRVGADTFLSLVYSGQKTHFVRFNFTNIEVMAPFIHGVGLELNGPLFRLADSTIAYTLTPKYLLATTDILTIDPGIEAIAKVQWQPQAGRDGMLLALEYTYSQQNDSRATQSHQSIVGFLGYRF